MLALSIYANSWLDIDEIPVQLFGLDETCCASQ